MKEEIGKPNGLVPLTLLRVMNQFYGIEHQSEPEMLYSFCAEGKSSPKRKSHCVFCTQPFSVTRMSEDWRVISRQLRRVLSASVTRRMSSRRSKCRQLFSGRYPAGR